MTASGPAAAAAFRAAVALDPTLAQAQFTMNPADISSSPTGNTGPSIQVNPHSGIIGAAYDIVASGSLGDGTTDPRDVPVPARGLTRVDEFEARHVIDRNRATGGGVTAGIDFALALMAEIAGADHARAVQLALEYDPAPPFDAGSPAKAGAALVEVYSARANRLAPNRRTDLIAAAERLGFTP